MSSDTCLFCKNLYEGDLFCIKKLSLIDVIIKKTSKFSYSFKQPTRLKTQNNTRSRLTAKQHNK